MTIIYSLFKNTVLPLLGKGSALFSWFTLCYLGRCKSVFHQFLYDLMQEVVQRIHVSGNETKPVFLPYCKWDKFGDIMANYGGCSIGLFDELVSFFATMNMYSSAKMQLSDSKEYQDFLQMYTGKTKTCETGMVTL